MANQNAFAMLKQVLRRYGLESLASWAFSALRDNTPPEQILLDLRETKEYKKRFPAMALRQRAGLRALSEEEYLNNEEAYRRTLNQFGLPGHMFDKPDDFVAAFENDLSPDELGQRAEIYDLVQRSPETSATVKAQFRNLLGAEEMSDEKLTRVLLGYEDASLASMRQAFVSRGGQDVSISEMRSTIQEAMRQEAARFRARPQALETQRGIEGLTGVAEEVY